MLFEKMVGPSFFQHMLHAESQHGPDVIVIQGIEHGLALPPETDEVRRFQNAQLVADRRLRQIQQPRDVAYAQLALKMRSWWLTADCVRFSSRAMSHTHSSLSKST